MNDCSDAETIVEESLDIYDSPSILKGLFHFRMETNTAEENKMYISDDGENSHESATDCPIISDDDEVEISKSAQITYEATNLESDPLGTDSADCQSEMSVSILTSRVPEKRMHSAVSPSDSPVFAHVLTSKFPRIHDVASSIGAEESLRDDLQSSMGALHFEPSPTPSSVTICPSQDNVHPLIPDLSQIVTTPPSSKSDSLLRKDTPADNSEFRAVTTPFASKATNLELEGKTLNPSTIQAVTTPPTSKSISLELEDNPPNPLKFGAITSPTHVSKSFSHELEDNPPNSLKCRALTTPAHASSLELEDNKPNPSECHVVTTPTHASKHISLELEDSPPNPSECQGITTPTASKCTCINLQLEDTQPNLSECQALTTPTTSKSINLEFELDNPPVCQAVTTTQSRRIRLEHKDTQSESPHQHIPTMQLLPNSKTPDGTVLTGRMPSLMPKNSQPKPSEQPVSGTKLLPRSKTLNKIADTRSSSSYDETLSPSLVSRNSQPKPSEQPVSGTKLLPRSKTPNEIADTRSSSSYDETLSVSVSKEEDEAVIEIKKMQQDIRQQLMHSGRDKSNENIKKGLQDMQGKLRQLGSKQQEQRRQLSVIMKQQAASSISSQSQLQPLEVKAQLQNMARRQQQLLKLLQSHKDLAATLHTQYAARHAQYAERHALQRQPADASQEHHSLLQDTSGVSRSINKTIRPPEPTMSNLPHTIKMKDAAKSSSVEADTPVVLSRSIVTTAGQSTSKIPPQSKETKSFKPPFKAKQAVRVPSTHQNTIILADSPPTPGLQLDSLGAEKISSLAGSEAQTRIVSLGSGSLHPQSPPFSQSSDISHGNFLPDKAVDEKETTINPRGNIANDKSSQKPTCIQITYPHLNQSSNNIREAEINYVTINKDNQDSTIRAPQKGNYPISVDFSMISNSPVGGLLDAVSKTQTGTTLPLPERQSLARDRSSAVGQSPFNQNVKQQAGPQATYIITSEKQVNILQNVRAQESTHHKKSTTTPSVITPTMTQVLVAPLRLQNTASKTTSTLWEAQKVHAASTNANRRDRAAGLPTASNRYSMLRTEPHTGTVSASSIQSQMSKSIELIQSTATPAADRSSDNQTIVGNPQEVTQPLSSTQSASLRPSTLQKEPGEDKCIPSLMDLLRVKLIQPGENVLTIKGKKHILGTATLNADGTVSPANLMNNFNTGSLPLMVSLVKHKSLNWITNNPKIWKSVFYKETPLIKLHSDYKDLIRSDPSQMVLKRSKLSPNLPNTNAAISMTAKSNILQPPIVTTSSAPMSTPSISRWEKPTESQDLFSLISTDPALSSGLNLTSSRLDPTPRGHDPTGHETQPPSGHETVSRPHDKNPHSLGPVSRGDISVPSRSHDLVSSLKRVLLISDDELMPASWGLSSNFWSAGNSNDAIINPEWIKDIDVWS